MKNWTSADIARLEAQGRVRGAPALANPCAAAPCTSPAEAERGRAEIEAGRARPRGARGAAAMPETIKQGAPKKRKGPNRWEARYHAERIAPEIAAGNVTWCEYEGLSFNIGTIARPCWYTPDWPMIERGRVVAVEVKGFMREAARLRLVAMTQRFPWVELRVVTRPKGEGWVVREWRAGA